MDKTAENEILTRIRTYDIGINDRISFIASTIRALIQSLEAHVTLRGKHIHHEIMNTGDDTVWLMNKGYDYSKEPYEISNEDWIYEEQPHCHLVVGSVDTQPSELTSPYARGNFQIEQDGQLYTLSAEVRRMPLKINVQLRYELDSYNDMLELAQVIIANVAYVQTFKFIYAGQVIAGSYKTPEAIDGQHTTELDGTTSESKNRTIEISLEVETTMPVYNPRTVTGSSMILNEINKVYINNHEIDERNPASRSGARGFGNREYQS